MVVPPLVWRSLRVPLGRILPLFLTTKRRDVEVVPGPTHLLVASDIDEVSAEVLVTLTFNALVPCHSSTSKSLSKSSVIVYQGMCSHPWRLFKLWMSACGARDAHASDVFLACKWPGCATWSAPKEQPTHARSGYEPPSRTWSPQVRRRRVNDQLTAAIEEIREAHPSGGALEPVFLVKGHPGHPSAFSRRARPWARVSSFSLISIFSRAAFHSSREMIGGVCMALPSQVIAPGSAQVALGDKASEEQAERKWSTA